VFFQQQSHILFSYSLLERGIFLTVTLQIIPKLISKES
jgi:hypothetical protein